MPTVNVHLSNGGAPSITNWNAVDVDSSGPYPATVVADLLDDSGASTGYSLTQEAISDAENTSPISASAPLHGWPVDVWEWWGAWNSAITVFTIGGLTQGDSFTLDCGMYRNGDGTRDTTFVVSEADAPTSVTVEDQSTSPAAPASFSGTVPAGGEITIGFTSLNSFAYFNGFVLTTTASGGSSTLLERQTRGVMRGVMRGAR